jgi:hypothetical protein
MLSREDVDAIISLIDSDAHASLEINDSLGNNSGIGALVPDKIAGGLRNLKFLLSGKNQNTDGDVYLRVCIGIADTTSSLINAYIRRRPALRRIRKAGTVTRNIDAMILPEHTATTIEMVDGQVHVLDWHSSLNVKNPVMYKTVTDFHSDRSVMYRDWKGWD